MSSGTREDFTGPPDPEPCSCEEALGLREKLEAALARADLQEELKGIALRGEQAALARAEAAELKCVSRHEAHEYMRQRSRADAAESRLAEATALLEQVEDCYADNEEGERLVSDVHAFLHPCDHSGIGSPGCTLCDPRLSATPAQAAEPTTNALLCYEDDCAKMTGRARPCPIHDAPEQAAEPDPMVAEILNCLSCGRTFYNNGSCKPCKSFTAPEHPDTIALRECRAELELLRETDPEELAAQVLKLNSVIEQQGIAAGIRIVSAESAVRALRAERDTALARIAQAVAELESVDHPPHHRIERALEALP